MYLFSFSLCGFKENLAIFINYPFPKQALVFYVSEVQVFENTVGNGEIARIEQFLLFHSVFYPFGELSAIFIKFKIVVCKLFQFGRV